MLKKIIFITVIAAVASCTGDSQRREAPERPDAGKQERAPLSAPPWEAEYNEENQQLELKQHPQEQQGLNQGLIVTALNKKYPGVQLSVESQIADTLIVSIADAGHLTREMGSAGAETYLAEATYSLTELPYVKAVRFNFEEGDHAAPGLYTRSSFDDFK